MGEDLGSVFHALWQEVALLHLRWKEFIELYGTKPSRIELLNRAAPYFFGMVQDLLWEATLLHIARLTDPPKTVGKENLSIRVLPDLIEDPVLRAEVGLRIEEARSASAFCRDWRNRRLAHRDRGLALEEGRNQLEPATRREISAAIAALGAVLDAISRRFLGSPNNFERVIPPLGNAEYLLQVLDRGVRAKDHRLERIRSGEYRDEDEPPHDL